MALEAVNMSTQNHNTCIIPMAQGGVLGAAIGYGLKYAYPLHKDEKNTPEYISVVSNIKKAQNSYTSWTKMYLDDISSKKQKSLAEDIFVKTYDGLKEGEKIGPNRILKAFHIMEKENPDGMLELKALFKDIKYEAGKRAKRTLDAYNLATKHFRPTGFFVIAGAVAGAIIALAHNVLKTDVIN